MTSTPFKSLALAAAIVAGTAGAGAVPALPSVMMMPQSDGTEIAVRLHGDEFHHYYTTADCSRIIAQADNGIYYFVDYDARKGSLLTTSYRADRPEAAPAGLATTTSADVIATLANRRAEAMERAEAAGKQIQGTFTNVYVPHMGSPKVLVVLVEFSDQEFIVENPSDFFTRMFTQPGFSDYNGTGSAREYFEASSMGAYSPDIQVLGPVKLGKSYSYYGGNTMWGNDVNVKDMVIEAVQKLDATTDFSEYDTNGDGLIDNVFIIYAGRGEATGGGADTVWPHSGDVTSATYTFDGKKLRHYACANEWYGNPQGGMPAGIGTFCHEFSHCLGLPDLYVTTTVTPTPFTPGDYELMDAGPYLNGGYTPPLHSAYERAALQWLEPTVLNSARDVRLLPIETSGQAYVIPTIRDNEYYILENRQRIGWDRFIPGHGMLVWHVDFYQNRWDSNTVNNSPSHQYCDLEEADNIQTDATRDGDPFPGAAGITSFTDTTTPSMKTWSGTPLGLPITDIAESAPDGVITFKIGGGGFPIPSTVAQAAADVTPRSFKAAWAVVEQAEHYLLSVWTMQGGKRVYAPGFDARNVGAATAFDVAGLDPATAYIYSVVAVGPESSSAPSNEIAVNTLALTHAYIIPEALEASAVGDHSFQANWQEVDGADTYVINVVERRLSGTASMKETFDGGSTEWFTSPGARTYSNSNYAGTRAPSLGLADGEFVCTAVFDGAPRTLSFYHRINKASADAVVMVEALIGSTWMPVEAVAATTSRKVTAHVRTLPADATCLRLRFSDPSGAATLYVDDIALTYGGTETRKAVDGFTARETGNTTSIVVEGLDGGTDHFYSIRAINGGVSSLSSAEKYVRTTGVSGIDAVSADARALNAFGSVGAATISAPEGTAIAVVDTAGRVVASLAASAQPVSVPLAAGIYMVHAADGATVKVIVK